jgi:membrane protease YdiL (CAAX protease family)
MDIVIIFLTPVILVASGLLVVRFRRLSWRDDVGLALPTPRDALLWGAGFLALALAGELVGDALGAESPGGSWRGKYDAGALAIRIAAIGFVYPLAEEFFFRGALLGILRRRIGAVVAIVLSAALFAGLHIQYEWLGMAMILGDGLYFAICRLRTGSLYLPMLFHVCGNLYAVWERMYG